MAFIKNTPENVSVISSNNDAVSISNINYTSSSITFDISTHNQVDINCNIIISVTVDNGDIYTSEFSVTVVQEFPTHTYSVEDLGTVYGFTLNSNGYYESNNKGINSSYAICKLNIEAYQNCTLYLDCINYAESRYDYGILSNLDSTLTSSAYADSTYKKSFKGSSNSTIQTVTYDITAGSHFIYIKYIKDSSGSNNNDSLQFKVRFE